MGKMIIVEDLDSSVTEAELGELLSEHGTIESFELFNDAESEENTQTAFVSVRSSRHGRALIAALNGQSVSGRALKVKAMKGAGGSTAGASSASTVSPGPRGRGARAFPGGRDGGYGRKGRGQGGGRNR